jgi:aspergillopepsin I
MLSFTVLLAASALTGTSLAVPVPQAITPKKGFTLAQSVPKPYQAGPVALAKTYLKYNVAVPDTVAAAAASGSGTVTATPEQYDSEYLCPVTIGGQTLNLDFDTGSSDL